MVFHILFTLDEHQDLVLKEALRKVLSVFPSTSAVEKLSLKSRLRVWTAEMQSQTMKNILHSSLLFSK